MRPLIGITASRHRFAMKIPGPSLLGAVLADDYAHGIEAAGGIPVVLPFFDTEEALLAALDRLDGFILSGGDDIDPLLYRQEPHVGLGSVTPERDDIEMQIVKVAVANGKPLLGICRGIQAINVALGGTLYQDLPREWQGRIAHSQKAPRAHLTHVVHVDPDSRLQSLLDCPSPLRTNSFHHQSVKDVAPDLTAVAWDDEGLVEAVEMPGDSFLVGVQWHPENLWRTSPEFLGLFRGLVDAARR